MKYAYFFISKIRKIAVHMFIDIRPTNNAEVAEAKTRGPIDALVEF